MSNELKEWLNKNNPTEIVYKLPLQEGDRIFKGEDGKYYLETYKRKEFIITGEEDWK